MGLACLKFEMAKTSKIRRDFGQLWNLTANTSYIWSGGIS